MSLARQPARGERLGAPEQRLDVAPGRAVAEPLLVDWAAHGARGAAEAALYARVKQDGVTVSALLAKAAGLALRKHPLINAAFAPADGGGIRYNADINVAMAVALDAAHRAPAPLLVGYSVTAVGGLFVLVCAAGYAIVMQIDKRGVPLPGPLAAWPGRRRQQAAAMGCASSPSAC